MIVGFRFHIARTSDVYPRDFDFQNTIFQDHFTSLNSAKAIVSIRVW